MSEELTYRQSIALNLRLSQRIIVEVGSGAEKRSSSVGLKAHTTGRCACARQTTPPKVRIDYHGDGEHPEDFIEGCPSRHFEPALQSAVYQAIALEGLGGLSALSERAIAHLPTRVVELYCESIAARDRLLSEREEVLAKLYRK